MAQQFIIPSVFEAIDRMSPAMAVMTRNVNAFGNQAEVAVARGERAFRKMMAPLNKISNSFNNVMGGLGAPVGIAALGYAVKSTSDIFIDFEAANSNVAAGLDMTTKQIRPLTDDAKRLGASTKFAAQQVSELQFEYAKLGFAPEQILKMTESTLSLAAATNFELGPSATTVGAALRAYGLEADQTARVTDVLAASASKTALDMMDFFQNLSTFAPVARAFNFSMEDSIALFGKIRDAGFDASSAATALRNIFLNLADGNGKLAKALGKPAANLQELLKGMITLRDAGVDLATMLEITDKRSVAAFATLLNGAESVGALADALHHANGYAKDMATTQMDNVKGSLKLLEAAWKGLVLAVEDGTGNIAKNIRTVASVFTDVLHIWSGSAKANDQLNATDLHIRHMSESVMFWGNVALRATEAVLLFKAALISTRVVMTAVNVAIGIGNALFTTSTILTYENVLAQRAYILTSKIASVALEVLHGNFAALNATMLANPAFLVAAGLGALATALYFSNKAQEEAIENYQHMLNLRVSDEYARQKKMVDELTQTYVNLGYSIENATRKSAEQKYAMSNSALKDAEVKVKQAEQEVVNAYDNAIFPAFSSDVSRANSKRDQAMQDLTSAKAGRAAQTGNIQSLVQSGVFSPGQAMNVFGEKPLDGIKLQQKQVAQLPQFSAQNQGVIDEMNRNVGGMKLTLEVKNDSDLPVALGSGSRTLDVQPKSKSTTVLDKK